MFAVPIPLRSEVTAAQVRAAARKTKNGPQARRLLALATIYDGGTRSDAAKVGGVTLQIVRDWVLKFNADGPPGLIDRKAPGHRPGSMLCIGPPLSARSKVAPLPPFMVLCDGVS
nr:helix-turn-helix domain-containing protein [uncultured Lichenicoccus sp.]